MEKREIPNKEKVAEALEQAKQNFLKIAVPVDVLKQVDEQFKDLQSKQQQKTYPFIDTKACATL